MVIIAMILFALSIPWNLEAEKMEKGKVYHGFKLVNEKYIKEVGAVAKQFEHVKSGARLVKVETKDDNNTFMILFATLPDSDSGMAHILEHSVLASSEKYRIKSPMLFMMKSSLKTFLNAFTGDDYTAYPFSTRNKKDFYNLLDFKLNAVFFPLLHKEKKIYYQEAWHYELDKPENEIVRSGIVYNEMKGAFSSPNSELNYQVQKNLFPDIHYAYNSGGYPDAIPELTYEKLSAFHKKYYHPSNAYIYLNGDNNVLEELEYIDRECLSKFDRTEAAIVPTQKPFDKMKEVTAHYAISAKADEKDKTFLSLGFVAGDASQLDVVMSLDLLADLLVNMPSAPVRKALADAGIGKDVSASVSNMRQNKVVITVKNANEADKEKFKQVVLDTLKKTVKQGIDKKKLEGAISRFEFRLREGASSWIPKSMLDGFNTLQHWLYTGNPFEYLEYEKPLAKMKTALKTDYMEKLIQKYFIDNPHSLLAVLKPKKGLAEERKKAIKEELAKYKASLSKEQIDRLMAETKELKAFQSRPDKPEDLAKMPTLTLKDVNPKAEFLHINKTAVDGVKTLHYPVFSNDIIYLRLMFDLSAVPQELLPYTQLLAEVLGELNTEKYSYGELNTELNIHTGGISARTYVYNNVKTGTLYPAFYLDSKALKDRFGKLTELEAEMLTKTIFKDKKRLKQVLTQLNSRMQARIERAGLGYALTRLESYLGDRGKILELLRGLSYTHFVSNIAKNFDAKGDEIIAKLENVSDLLFNKSNAMVALTCSKEDFAIAKEKLPTLLAALGTKKIAPNKYTFKAVETNEGLTAASRVQYVVKGFNFKNLGYDYSGKFKVAGHMLRNGYLFQKIRILGGAYGTSVDLNKDGNLLLNSYRDPKLLETVKVFDNSPKYLEELKADKDEMTRNIIGTVSRMDPYMSPYTKGNRALGYYLDGTTAKDLQKERDEVLGTTLEDVKNAAKMIKDVMSKGYICVYGNEKKLEENKTLFKKLVKVSE